MDMRIVPSCNAVRARSTAVRRTDRLVEWRSAPTSARLSALLAAPGLMHIHWRLLAIGVLLVALILTTRIALRSERRRRQADHEARHDPLTGLPNRRSLERLLQKKTAAIRPGEILAVGLVDLDLFKEVNDVYGHEVGDALLREAVSRIRLCLSGGDTLARLGGDEFVIVMRIRGPKRSVKAVGRSVQVQLRAPFVIGGHALRISSSIGWAVNGDGAAPVDGRTLLQRADMTMYEAKRAGRDRMAYFSPRLDEARAQRGHLRQRLADAISEDRLELHFQPIVSVGGEAAEPGVPKVEALLRVRESDGSLSSAGQYASVLDDPGLSVRIGRFVMREALAQGTAWRKTGLQVGMSINVSPVHFLLPGFVEELRQVLSDHPQFPPDQLWLEITERGALLPIGVLQAAALACHRLGVRLSLDDFGTGNAALSHVQHLNVLTLKIDASFVRTMLTRPRDLAIVAGMARMSQLLGIEAVAEGVETREQALVLAHLGCTQLQGFGIARPMAGSQCAAWIASFSEHLPWVKDVMSNAVAVDLDAVAAMGRQSRMIRRLVTGKPSPAERTDLLAPDAASRSALGRWCRTSATRTRIPQFRMHALHAAHERLYARIREVLSGLDSGRSELETLHAEVERALWGAMMASGSPQGVEFPAITAAATAD